MKDTTFVYVTFIKTTPEKLWEALTNSDFIKKYWFGSTFDTDWKVGSKIKEIHENDDLGFQGEILEFNPPKKLSYSFVTSDEIETRVTFSIESHEGTVTLTVTHVGYEKTSKAYRSASIGWSAILSGMKTLLETGNPLEKRSIYNLYARLAG